MKKIIFLLVILLVYNVAYAAAPPDFYQGNPLKTSRITMVGRTTVTIATGVIVVSKGVHLVETQGAAATDDLETINGGVDGSVVKSRVHEWFYEGGLAIPASKKYMSAFESVWYDTSASSYLDHDGSISAASDDKAVSLPGYKPLTYAYRGTTTPNFRVLHTNFGANHHSQGFFAYEAMWLLMTVEYASLNAQSYLPGYTQASAWAYAATRRTGRTMLLGNMSGSIEPSIAAGQIDADVNTSHGIVAGEKVANSYRGVENIYGHLWKWIDGININFDAAEGRIHLSNNPSQWAENTTTNYTDTGLGFPLSNGYGSALHPGRLLTKLVAGGSTTYLCDYFYQPGASAGWRGFLAGGHLGSGVGAGPACLTAVDSGSGVAVRVSAVGLLRKIRKENKMKNILIILGILFITASSALAADVKLDWDAVDGAAGYKIAMSTDLGVTWLAPMDVKLVKPYTYLGVAEDKLVLFKAGAYNASGNITWNEWAYAAYDHRKKPLIAPTGTGIQ